MGNGNGPEGNGWSGSCSSVPVSDPSVSLGVGACKEVWNEVEIGEADDWL